MWTAAILHTQEVTGSSPVAPTIKINNLQAVCIASCGDVRRVVRKRVLRSDSRLLRQSSGQPTIDRCRHRPRRNRPGHRQPSPLSPVPATSPWLPPSALLHSDRFVDEQNQKTILSRDQVRLLDKANLTIPILSEPELKLRTKIYSASARIGDIGHCYTGEVDLTLGVGFVSPVHQVVAPIFEGIGTSAAQILDEAR